MRQNIYYIFCVCAVTLGLAILVGCSERRAAAVMPTCTGSLQKKIDAAPAGSVVYASPCIYREQVTINKPITLDGGGVSQIRGSDVWAASRFTALSNGTWKAPNYPNVPHFYSRCEPNTSRCKWPEQVYYDGIPLTQVDPSVTPKGMQFAVDSNRNLIVGADPSGHLVEVSVRSSWVRGAQGANGVTIRGFTMKHATGSGISNQTYPNWTIKNCDLSYAHRANLTLTQGSGLKAMNVHSHDAGQVGLNGTNAGSLVVEGGQYNNNNTEQFDPHWHAGGMKIATAHNVTVDSANVHDNYNNGIWLDVPESPQDLVVSNNWVHHNPGHGIRVEVQTNVAIFGNKVWENGWGGDGGGITVSASSNVSVHDNVLAWNANGIRIMNPNRSNKHPDQGYYDYVRNNLVASNTIVQEGGGSTRYALGWFKQWSGGNIYHSNANNRGRDNRYYYTTAEGSEIRYSWTNRYKKLVDFNATPGEENGTYMSAAQKDAALQEAGIPTQPEPH